MPITFHFRPEENLVVCIHKGSRSDILESYKSMYENDSFDISMNRLVDVRQVGSSDISKPDSLEQLASFTKSQFAGVKLDVRPKIAIIAPSDIGFGMSRMYEIYSDVIPWDLVVFRSVESALAWLGLPEDFMDSFDNETQ